MKNIFCFFLIYILASSAVAKETATLQKVEWGRDKDNANLIYLGFVFDHAPNHYPAFFVDKPPTIHIDFNETQLNAYMIPLQNVPPPLTKLALREKELKDGTTIVQVDVGVEKKFPFYTKMERNIVLVLFDVSASLKQQKVVLNKKGSGEGNSIQNIAVRSLQDYVEILVTLTNPLRFTTIGN